VSGGEPLFSHCGFSSQGSLQTEISNKNNSLQTVHLIRTLFAKWSSNLDRSMHTVVVLLDDCFAKHC
jgi:hypothetical protein